MSYNRWDLLSQDFPLNNLHSRTMLPTRAKVIAQLFPLCFNVALLYKLDFVACRLCGTPQTLNYVLRSACLQLLNTT